MQEPREMIRTIEAFFAFVDESQLLTQEWKPDSVRDERLVAFMGYAGFSGIVSIVHELVKIRDAEKVYHCNPTGGVSFLDKDGRTLFPETKWLDEVLQLWERLNSVSVEILVTELMGRLRDPVHINVTKYGDELILPRITHLISDTQFGQFPKSLKDPIGKHGEIFGTHNGCGGVFTRGIRNPHMDYVSCSKGCGTLVVFPNTTTSYMDLCQRIR